MHASDLAPQLWRGLLRQSWGRLTGNRRLIAAGRLELTLARIARAHARVNREARHDLGKWREHRAFFSPRPDFLVRFSARRPQLRLVR